MKTIAICGPGSAGKDCAGEYLGHITMLRYVGALSWVGRHAAMRHFGVLTEMAYQSFRHEYRMELKDFFNAYRRDDPARLIRDSLALGEIVVGIREKVEIEAARQQKLINHYLWIDNPFVPPDPTLSYGPELCDDVITNEGLLCELHRKLTQWAKFCLLPLRGLP